MQRRVMSSLGADLGSCAPLLVSIETLAARDLDCMPSDGSWLRSVVRGLGQGLKHVW